ncbi:heterokaryon incompatibility protein-domain-containing protein [Cercophora newfieldiana]|uniref:Heterokaryon incompatibility protein-domain-containing protein n=1 Tax=Cercophora newfieldiana TaxID=92897 RepID=A0AA39YCB0_9PEZI|nr:heterokaryon incompatibility protein-domain-containing protein [Cercophora newfieldiana]
MDIINTSSTGDETETYKYKRIDLASDAIRLVYLARGYRTDPIECRLFETWLHEIEGVPYEALSYHWGGSDRDAEIILDGCKAKVTNNLHQALLHLRLEDRDRILWVDAICIDQDDEKERGHQVGQMRSVYKNAEQVVVWLGPSTDDIDLLVDRMNEMREYLIFSIEDSEISLAVWEKFWRAKDLSHRYRAALEDLFSRRWFRRVWVIQEVASARAAVVVCGRRSIPTETFVQVPSMANIKPKKHIQAVLDVMPGPLRKKSWWDGKRDLHTLMVKFVASEATDQRDKIYALLGISSDAFDNSAFPPNYEKSFADLLRDTARFLIFGTVSGATEYKLPAITMTELIQDIGRVRRDAAQWAVEKLDPASLSQFLKYIKLGSEDERFLWKLTAGLSDARLADSAPILLQTFGVPDGLTWLGNLIVRGGVSVLDILIDHGRVFAEEEMYLFIRMAMDQKSNTLRLLLSRLKRPVDGSVLKSAGESGDPLIIGVVLDHYYGGSRPAAPDDPGFQNEYNAMSRLLQSHYLKRGGINVNVEMFVEAVRQGYDGIPKLLLPSYHAPTVNALLKKAIDDKDFAVVEFVLSHSRYPVIKDVLLQAIETGRCDIFTTLLARREVLGLTDLADLVRAVAEYQRMPTVRGPMVRLLLRCVGAASHALVWDIALKNALSTGDAGLLSILEDLKSKDGNIQRPERGSESQERVDWWDSD